MKGLETGKDKIQKICDALRKETLDPAKQEAREIVENAHLAASEIIHEGKKKAEEVISKAEKAIEEKKKIFESSLGMACRQGIERLKQKIEEELFDRELFSLVEKEMGNPKVVAHILNAFMKTMEEKGIEDDFVAVIPKSIAPRSISALLAAQVLERLKKEKIAVGDFAGGVKVQLKERKVTIDISDEVVRELIAEYIRRDFRDLIFSV
jgi:V/A-type H+/Na+-transporting ATPase subunit E